MAEENNNNISVKRAIRNAEREMARAERKGWFSRLITSLFSFAVSFGLVASFPCLIYLTWDVPGKVRVSTFLGEVAEEIRVGASFEDKSQEQETESTQKSLENQEFETQEPQFAFATIQGGNDTEFEFDSRLFQGEGDKENLWVGFSWPVDISEEPNSQVQLELMLDGLEWLSGNNTENEEEVVPPDP